MCIGSSKAHGTEDRTYRTYTTYFPTESHVRRSFHGPWLTRYAMRQSSDRYDTPPSRASRLRFATAWQARRYITVFPFDSIPMQTMCRKSTSVTVQTLYLLRIQTVPCISLQPFFIFKTYVPLFLFCGNAKRKSEHKKFWKRIGGAGGKEKTFFKRFFLSPAGKVPHENASGMLSSSVCRNPPL